MDSNMNKYLLGLVILILIIAIGVSFMASNLIRTQEELTKTKETAELNKKNIETIVNFINQTIQND